MDLNAKSPYIFITPESGLFFLGCKSLLDLPWQQKLNIVIIYFMISFVFDPKQAGFNIREPGDCNVSGKSVNHF